MPLLSVVVPIRDMAGRLGPLVSWVNEALSLDCEIVLVHDFLDQRTEDELVRFVTLQRDKKVKFVSSTYNSPGLARNAGLSETSGEFIAFWDSDDLPQVKEALKIASECQMTNSDIGIGSFQTCNETGEFLRKYPIKSQNNLTRIAIYPGLWRMLFRASILKKIKFTNLLLAEDQIFLTELKPAEKKILFRDNLVYKYTLLRKGSLTSVAKNLPDLISALLILLNQIGINKNKNSIDFELTLFIRNSITVIKNGTNQQKMQVLQIIKKVIVTHPISVVRILFIILIFKLKEMRN